MFVLCLFSPQYMSKVEPWCKACGEGELPSELQDLEDTIHHHQGLYEHITTAYSEVSSHMHADVIMQNKKVHGNIEASAAPHEMGLIIIQTALTQCVYV